MVYYRSKVEDLHDLDGDISVDGDLSVDHLSDAYKFGATTTHELARFLLAVPLRYGSADQRTWWWWGGWMTFPGPSACPPHQTSSQADGRVHRAAPFQAKAGATDMGGPK